MDREAFQSGYISLMRGHIDDDSRSAFKPLFPKVLRWSGAATDGAANIEALPVVPKNVNLPALTVYIRVGQPPEALQLLLCSPALGHPPFSFCH